jgi:hypothetical protein
VAVRGQAPPGQVPAVNRALAAEKEDRMRTRCPRDVTSRRADRQGSGAVLELPGPVRRELPAALAAEARHGDLPGQAELPGGLSCSASPPAGGGRWHVPEAVIRARRGERR